MPRPRKDNAPQKSRAEIVGILMELFRNRGYEAASLSDISEATGLGKSSLYYHFPGGKTDMAAAVMEMVAEWAQDHLIAPLHSGPREKRVDALLSGFDALYSGGRKPCVIAALAVDAPDATIMSALNGVLGDIATALEGALIDSGVDGNTAHRLALDSLSRIQGALVLSKTLDDPAAFSLALENIRSDLAAA